VPTLDTHQALQIFHRILLVDEVVNHPEPFTQVTAEDVATGRWRIDAAAAGGLGLDPDYAAEHLRTGAPIVYTSRYDVTMQRPDKLRILMPGDGPASEFYYDGKSMVVYAPAENLAAVADAPPTIDAALKAVFDKAAIFYPRPACPECGSAQLEWEPASGRATVHTFSIARRELRPRHQDRVKALAGAAPGGCVESCSSSTCVAASSGPSGSGRPVL